MIARLKALAARAWRNDKVQRAAHTFWQAAAMAAITEFAGSGMDLAHLADVSADAKIVTAAVIAGGAAVFSYLKSTLVAKAKTP